MIVMTPQEYSEESIRVLDRLASELDNRYVAVMKAVGMSIDFSDYKDVMQAIHETAFECRSLIDHYDGEPLPSAVREKMSDAQSKIGELASALVLHAFKLEGGACTLPSSLSDARSPGGH